MLFYLSFVCYLGSAQQPLDSILLKPIQEVGYPFITNYSPKTYNAFPQNWGFTKDSLGILYVANGDGVLTYDGVHWDLLELPGKTAVFSIAKDAKGKIYVGGLDDFGYLQANTQGSLEYISLAPFLGEENKKINPIFYIYTTPDEIYFSSGDSLYRWDGSKFKIWRGLTNALKVASPKDNRIYQISDSLGLLKLTSDEFKAVPGGQKLVNQRLRFVLPLDNKLLIGTDSSLYTYDGKNLTTFQTDASDFFKENRLFSGEVLLDGSFAIGSLSKGILIIDKNGIKTNWFLGEELLISDAIYNLFQDSSGLLWAGSSSGIIKLEYPSPFSRFGKPNNVDGRAFEIVRYNGKIHIASGKGLFFLDIDSDGISLKAKPYPEINQVVFDLLISHNDLLVGSVGLFKVDEKGPVLLDNASMYCIVPSKLDPNRVFAGHTRGLFSLYWNEGIRAWEKEKTFEMVGFDVFEITEDAAGNLWLKTNANNVTKVEFEDKQAAENLHDPKLKRYGVEHGFPDKPASLYLINQEIYLNFEEGISKFDEEKQQFILDTALGRTLGIEDGKIQIRHVDHQGNIWFLSSKKEKERFIAWYKENGKYSVQPLQEQRIANTINWNAYVEKADSVIWYSNKSGGIIRHDISTPLYQINNNPTAVISKVSYKTDSLLYGGKGKSMLFELPYKNNQLRFEYAGPNFYQEDNNQFQYYLEGYDEEWSSWSSETQKDYSNLSEGEYTFKVRAKNVFNYTSEAASYVFHIMPPWYRTWWSYGLYGLSGLLLLMLYSRWRSQQLRAKNLALEKLIDARTIEIKEKNKQLEQQTEKLKELDSMKTRLFANISHEFRTPLTLIKGPIEKLEDTQENKISTVTIKMIRRNADRLLKLVNQLLDLSKLDSGKLELNLAEGDIFKCLRAAASSFSSHAAQRQIDYQIKIPSRSLWTSFDRDKLEKITYNLLSNAFKFTPDREKITIEVTYKDNLMQLKISDSGKGIEASKLPYIFDRFFQVDDSYTKEKAGSGIGLALTKELTHLMDGEIYVESKIGQGSMFKVMLEVEEIQYTPKENIDPEDITENNIEEPLITILEQQSAKKKKYQVLIVEDNNDMRHFIKEQLQSQYAIIEAFNGKEGLKKANKSIPDLIVTDLMMPQMDGITLCKALKTGLTTSHIPVIMLTAKAGIENKLEGLEIGADDYLTKPFHARELVIRVNNLIAERKKLRQLFSKKASIDPTKITVTSLDEQFLKKTLELLENQYADSQFGVPQMQTALGMSKTQLHRKIKALTDYPPGELLRNFRLKRAAQLLAQKGENVSQIAYAVGFNSVSYFTKCFKGLYGNSPSQFNKE